MSSAAQLPGALAFIAMSAMLSVPKTGIEIADRDEKQRRGDEVQHRIFQAPSICSRSEPRISRPKEEISSTSNQTIEVEDVAGQKCAADAGKQQHQERKKP